MIENRGDEFLVFLFEGKKESKTNYLQKKFCEIEMKFREIGK